MSHTLRLWLTLAAIALSAIGALPATGQLLSEDFILTPSDPAENDRFGISITNNNGIIAVGAFLDDDNGIDSGSAYLFDALTGTQLFKLLPNNGMPGDYFGQVIEIDNQVVAVGGINSTDINDISGSVYLFDALTGTQLFKLLPIEDITNSWFGRSIAIGDGIVAVGAPFSSVNFDAEGSVFLFDANTGEQLYVLNPIDGTANQFFGFGVAIDNGILAATRIIYENNAKIRTSVVCLFDVNTGTQIFELRSNDGVSLDQNSRSLAINNDVVAVGAPNDDENGPSSGSAYLFDVTTGEQISKLIPSDGSVLDRFGHSVDIDDGFVVVGSRDDNSGSAYLFDVTTGKQLVKLLPSNGSGNDKFGVSASIDDGVIAVGAIQNDENGDDAGSAYVFDLGCVLSNPANLNGDVLLNFLDVSAFLEAFGAQDPAADFTGEGLFNFFDVSAFLAVFGAGCP